MILNIMANYRREIKQMDLKKLHLKYKDHDASEGGIFTKDKRRKLLGLKPEHGKHHEDTADFWLDVRSTVKSGLKDLELFFEVAHPDQIEKILEPSLSKEELEQMKETKDQELIQILWQKPSSLLAVLRSLLQDHVQVKIKKTKEGHPYRDVQYLEKDDSWRAMLAENIIVICLQFLQEHNFMSSKIQQRQVEELKDMINVEVGRGFYLKREKRVKGWA